MSFDEIVQQCRDLNELLPAQALEQARQSRPGLEGFAVFPVYAPVEIIHAAGLLPVGLFGVGGKLEIVHADARFQSFICSIAKSALELFLRDEMSGFRGAVFSSICDVARNLASLVKRNAPQMFIEYLHLPQNMLNERSHEYTRAELDRFRANLARHVGRPIPDESLATSLKLYNRVRRRLRELYAFRREHPGSITAAELCTVVQAGSRMMPEDYAPLLERLLKLASQRPAHPRDSVDVVIEGAFCEQPPVLLIETIEAAGCQVRDDDLLIGWRWFREDVPVNGDALSSLATAYLTRSEYSSVRHDGASPRTDGLLQRVRSAGAQAVIFTPAKFCEPALFDYVPFIAKLDKHGIPHLKLEFEEKMWTFEASRTEIETFAESMLFE
ncbi:MAG: 2-hydroxyacyl-CoA dehydratase [Phycisphaerae bacterium]|nr:2-hydroxyacyl-CoA dehydratase [Phycisphaerae bacterium]